MRKAALYIARGREGGKNSKGASWWQQNAGKSLRRNGWLKGRVGVAWLQRPGPLARRLGGGRACAVRLLLHPSTPYRGRQSPRGPAGSGSTSHHGAGSSAILMLAAL